MKGINMLSILVREVATDLLNDQLAFNDLAMASKNAKLIKSCNIVEFLKVEQYIDYPEQIADVYSMAVIWELTK